MLEKTLGRCAGHIGGSCFHGSFYYFHFFRRARRKLPASTIPASPLEVDGKTSVNVVEAYIEIMDVSMDVGGASMDVVKLNLKAMES